MPHLDISGIAEDVEFSEAPKTETFFQKLLVETEREIIAMQWNQEGLANLLDIRRRCKIALEIGEN